jgi:hypothetical protein
MTVATSLAINPNEVMMARMVGSGGVCIWLESGVRRSDLRFHIWFRHREILQVLYFQCDLQRWCCNKVYYCSTQKSFITVNFDGSYYASCFMSMENKMGGCSVCTTHGRNEKHIVLVWSHERNWLTGRLIFTSILNRKQYWIQLGKDRDQWWTLLNTAMSLTVQ